MSDTAENAGPAEAGPGGSLIAVGRIGGPYGLHGAAYVEPWTDAPEERYRAGAVLQTEPQSRGPLTVTSSQWHGDRFVVSFHGFESRTEVVDLRGTQLLIHADSRPPLADPDEFYDSDLEGLRAVGVDGGDYGVVEQMVHLAAADYLSVQLNGARHLVPFVAAIVVAVDVHAGRVVIDAPDGLFEL
jgi:16S rRNA processing protein RimM